MFNKNVRQRPRLAPLLAVVSILMLWSLASSSAMASPMPMGSADTVAITTDTVHVLNMVCGSCDNRLKTKLRKVAGVQSVQADHETGTVIVEHNPSLTKDDIEKSISKIGYSTKTHPANKAAHEGLPSCCKKENQ